MNWLMRATGLSKLSLAIIAGVVVLAIIALGWALYGRSQDKLLEGAVQQGAAQERAATATESARAVETANMAEAEMRADPAREQALCEKYSRTPENCA